MFQYTNTIVLNSLKDVTTGLDKIVKGTDSIEVRRVNKFLKENVSAIHKRTASDPVIGKAEFTITNLDVGIYRLKLYIRLSGSQNSYYSNDFVFKGKPFVYEFRITSGPTSGPTSATDVAKEIKRVIDKIQALYGDKYIRTEVKDNKLIIHGVDEYQLFTEAKIQKLNTAANNPLTNEVYEDIIEGTITKSVEGFGTYTHILKDLRLPTIEARRFEAVNQEELPIPGMKYNQYTIYYTVDRGLFGGAAVGQQVTSKTTHVFYVLESIAAKFEVELAVLGALTTEKKPIFIKSGVQDVSLAKHSTKQDITPAIEEGTVKWVDAETEADWITVTPGITKVDIISTDNETGKSRSALVKVTVKDETGAVAAKEITVTQAST